MSWMLKVSEAERGRAVGPSSLVKLFLCDAFHAAGAARNAGANHYRARLASSPRGWPANIEMHRHQFFAEFEFVPVNSTMEHEIGARKKREKPLSPSPHFAGAHHEIYLAGEFLHAGRLEAGGLQPSSKQRRRQSERVKYCYVHTYCGSFAFWVERTVSGASTQPTSGVELEPSGTEKRVLPSFTRSCW